LYIKQKVDARNSTESELVEVDDLIAKILCTKKFTEWQGYEVQSTVLYKYNTAL